MNQKLIITLLSSLIVACATSGQQNTTTQPSMPVVSPKTIQGYAPITHSELDAQDDVIRLEQIMADPDWIGRQPHSPYWADNSKGIFYTRKKEGSPLSDLWAISNAVTLGDAKKVNGQRVSLGDIHQYAYQDRVLDSTGNNAAWVYEGNIFTKDMTTGKVSQLSRDGAQPSQLKFLVDGRLSFQISNSIYALSLTNGFREKLASWLFADAPKAIEPAKDYIQQQQIDLIEVIAKKRQDKALQFKNKQKLQSVNVSLAPKPFYFPKAHQVVEAVCLRMAINY
jgi:hypothetical protein